jgi:hypothetical protein
MKIHAKSDGDIRLIPPQGQTVASIHSSTGQSVSARKDGAIHLNKNIFYEVTFR